VGKYLETKITTVNIIEWHNRFQQQAQWTASIRKYLLKQFNKPVSNVLEVGSGTDAVLRQYSEDTGFSTSPQLYGIDINFPFLLFSNFNNPNLTHICADGTSIPFASNTFDLTYCHYLLLWIETPLELLNEMKRVTKPEGYIIAFAEPDYRGRIDYPEELGVIGEWQLLALQKKGADPTIGRKLKSLFFEADLSEIKIGIVGAEWQLPDHEIDELEWQMIYHDVEDFISNNELDYYKSIDLKSRLSNNRILFVPTFYAIGKKK
jgi:ubiquinone/menaquinone biosynthesis C-methylase UbiE